MAGRFNVAKAMQKGGIDNPALDMGSGLTLHQEGDVQYGSQSDLTNSFCHLTMEALPRADYYKNNKDAMKRPSLGELHGEPRTIDINLENGEGKTIPPEDPEHSGMKLGWIVGVLIPCLLNIWGVMLFLRLSWVVGQAGILESLLIILASATVCVLTTLSMSAICTNGEVKGGGIYYIISRSLGPEFGASVGVIFAFANAVAASMNTIGFCDSLNDLLRNYDLKIVDGGLTDVRIVGTIALLIMIIICAVGMEWESKAQNFLIVVIVAAIIDFLVGTLIGPNDDISRARGFTGFNTTVFMENWGSSYRYSENVNQNMFTVFAIFFPSVTGIQAGANISGDLKDPADAIPKGTLLALLISMISYALFVLFAGGASLRDATGDLAQYYAGNYTSCAPGECQWGLHNNYSMMQLMSVWGLLIYAGCFAATLSTALTNLLSVPRLIQALGIDRIYPGLIFFSKGYGKHGEPYRGYVLTFIISAAFVLIAEINVIAPLISNFYLASYALINFCTFHAALVRPLGWRPTFRYYNKWLSLAAFFLCIIIMFLLDWMSSIITFVVFFVLYLVVIYRNPNVNWGSSTQAQTYKRALMTMHKLFNQSEHVKNYQPQILLLVGQPQARPPLVDLANLITRNNSLLICADIYKQRLTYRQRMALQKQGQAWLGIRKVKGFFTVTDGYKFEVAARGLMQCSGVGRLKPNVLMMGYKSDWLSCHVDDLQTYFNIMHDAFENRLAVTILRLPEGLDFSKPMDLSQVPEELSASMGDLSTGTTSGNGVGMVHNDSNLSYILPSVLSQTSLTIPGSKPTTDRPSAMNPWENNPSSALKQKKKKIASQILHQYEGGQEISKSVLDNMMTFTKKQKGGVIDVWWLYDDGGLTILLPYILSTRSMWSNCKLRVFALANRTHELKSEEQGMANLLAKFRINYTSLTMIHDISEPPRQGTITFFENLISGFRESNKNNTECVVTDDEYRSLREKTYRQLRLRELLQQHSRDSTLVVMSLPMPRKGLVSAPLYMAWLEAITNNMPPFLLVRGNQTSVLTFYS
ncbi:bumetanide-sensitive sodium-(potassium)-chloride cotransporter isoform X2 [Macrosteles quadrilineatus]|nr:bumetanide-sensitive sodium-(potassium)-chloride cotransporter isoform X2 [Macrosteles quadrilineatus]